jgi:hypothetical protein
MTSVIEESSNLNQLLNKLIKDVINYEDKDMDINIILLSIRFPESSTYFDEVAFKSDIKYAYKCIKKFKSKNKKIKISKYIEDINRYVLTYLEENHQKTTVSLHLKSGDKETLDKDFFESLKYILNIDLDPRSQEAIGYIVRKIFDNIEYNYVLEIFEENSNTLNIIKNIITKQNIYNDNKFVISLYIIIDLISKNIKLSYYLRKFLTYDLEKQLTFILNNTENLLKYVGIINTNNRNIILNALLKEHMKYIILYIENKDDL